jgi:nucleotide-binding universal stress UspA family protein
MANRGLDLWALTGARSDVAAPPIGIEPWGATVARRTGERESVRPAQFFNSSDRAAEQTTSTAVHVEDELEAPRNVVVALDSSPGAANVLESALRTMRGMPSAALHVVHVFRASRMDHARAGVPLTPSSVIEEAKQEHLEARVREARPRSRGQVIGHFAVGDPTTEVLRLCRDLKADLLVVGSHEHHGLERWLLGSIAETFLRKAKCPVLVVRSRRGA